MADRFIDLLTATQDDALRMREMASSSLRSDPHPHFWEYAVSLSSRWCDAVSSASLDWSVLGELREEARTEKHRAGIWLFGFCNGLEKAYVALREASLVEMEEQKAKTAQPGATDNPDDAHRI